MHPRAGLQQRCNRHNGARAQPPGGARAAPARRGVPARPKQSELSVCTLSAREGVHVAAAGVRDPAGARCDAAPEDETHYKVPPQPGKATDACNHTGRNDGRTHVPRCGPPARGSARPQPVDARDRGVCTSGSEKSLGRHAAAVHAGSADVSAGEDGSLQALHPPCMVSGQHRVPGSQGLDSATAGRLRATRRVAGGILPERGRGERRRGHRHRSQQ
jgi:hypothetical protein